MKAKPGTVEREREFTRLYEAHYGAVLAYGRRRVGEEAARDIAAETFLIAWRRLEDVPERQLPWLYGTASNVLRNWRRAQGRKASAEVRLLAQPMPVHVPDHAIGCSEADRVHRALACLGGRDRELLTLVVWEQLPVKDAAAVVGTTSGAAAVRLHRARKKVSAVLEPGGLAFEVRSQPLNSQKVAP